MMKEEVRLKGRPREKGEKELEFIFHSLLHGLTRTSHLQVITSHISAFLLSREMHLTLNKSHPHKRFSLAPCPNAGNAVHTFIIHVHTFTSTHVLLCSLLNVKPAQLLSITIIKFSQHPIKDR